MISKRDQYVVEHLFPGLAGLSSGTRTTRSSSGLRDYYGIAEPLIVMCCVRRELSVAVLFWQAIVPSWTASTLS